jgi:hypothetical protein
VATGAAAGAGVCAETNPQFAVKSAATTVHRKGQGAEEIGIEKNGEWEEKSRIL